MGPDPRLFLALADRIKVQRSALLAQWRAAVTADQRLTAGNALPKSQLDDHVPNVLIAFERHLTQPSSDPDQGPSRETIEAANAHGMHRWQQGYNLREVIRELGHLNRIMVRELDAFAAATPGNASEMSAAREAWALVYTAGVEQSTSQFFQLLQREAAGHVKDLEAALIELRELDHQRAALWQEVAHDLRGNVGVMAAATRALAFKNAPAAARDKLPLMLERNLDSLRHLLDDVTSLTRLQAGDEHRQDSEFDVSLILRPMCEGMQALAEQRGLYLRHEGPDGGLQVEGDAVKVRRLAQNLIINALKYTEKGGVEVRWAACDSDDRKRWSLTVRDTGPGIHAGPGSPLVSALEEATDLAQETTDFGEGTTNRGQGTTNLGQGTTNLGRESTDLPHETSHHRAGAAASARDTRPVQQAHGEGIGLSIVKRLAELLDATVEVESNPVSGTVFTILFPKSYTQ